MNIKQAYNSWAAQYDTNHNKTRDLEGQALRYCLENISFATWLEIGCGTGKNTGWLVQKAKEVTAVDLSEEMLARAKGKIRSDRIQFRQADITNDWTFGTGRHDLVSFSLVLEHIQNLDHVFREAAAALVSGGHVYIGELHPFKQYAGTQARFDTADGRQEVDCYNHHVSDFVRAAKMQGLTLKDLNEYFDEDDRTTVPRILTLILQKPWFNQ